MTTAAYSPLHNASKRSKKSFIAIATFIVGLTLIFAFYHIKVKDYVASRLSCLGAPSQYIVTGKPPKRAVFSFLQDSLSYVPGALALGESIRRNSGLFDDPDTSTHPDMVMMIFKDLNDPVALRNLTDIGWQIRVVEPVAPFKEGYYYRFKHQYTKVLMWNMIEYDALLYIDSDCIVKGELGDLYGTVEGKSSWEFAVVGDAWSDRFDLLFNAGVMLIKPSTASFDDIMKRGPTLDYPSGNAEQGMLNAFYEHRFLRLPYIYNLNLVMYDHFREIWKKLWDDTRIIHYTLCKPFVSNCEAYGEANDYWNLMKAHADQTLESKRKSN